MRLSALVVESSRAILAAQEPDGSFPAGHNGPYHDPETPVRTTAHWAITLLRAYQLTGESAFADAARRALGYLLSPAARPMAATFHCRTSPDKDMCNGLIGQAWAIEALAVVGEALAVPDATALAQEVFLLHPFDDDAGLWRRVNVDGSRSTFDLTFNHQLWFAAAGGTLPHASEPAARTTRFLDAAADGLLRTRPDGRIRHAIPHPSTGRRTVARLGRWRARLRHPAQSPGRRMAAKELGYQAFNLYALALLRREFPGHRLWSRPVLARALGYVNDERYERGLEDNAFGYPYNPPGFEVAYAAEVFDAVPWRRGTGWWVEQQLRRTYDPDTKMLARGTADPATLASRLYEAVRLSDVAVRMDGSVREPAVPAEAIE